MTEYDIDWTFDKLQSFKVAYTTAARNRSWRFKFEGHLFNTDYAFYLIEHLENQGTLA